MRIRTQLGVLAVVALGLSAGAMLTEAIVLVGYWRSLTPEEFLDWFRRYEPALVAYYGPLEVSALLSSFVALFAYAFPKRPGFGEMAVAAALSIAVLALYLVYFEDVNSAFVTGTIPLEQVASELTRWSAWQWGRTAVGISAFVMSALALRHGADQAPRKAASSASIDPTTAE